jgi:hypothetical protein
VLIARSLALIRPWGDTDEICQAARAISGCNDSGAVRLRGWPGDNGFQNVNGANDGQYYVSPYLGTLNGQTVRLFCHDDILNEVNFCCGSGPRTRIERPEPGGAADAAGVAMFGYHDGSAGFTAEDMLL